MATPQLEGIVEPIPWYLTPLGFRCGQMEHQLTFEGFPGPFVDLPLEFGFCCFPIRR